MVLRSIRLGVKCVYGYSPTYMDESMSSAVTLSVINSIDKRKWLIPGSSWDDFFISNDIFDRYSQNTELYGAPLYICPSLG